MSKYTLVGETSNDGSRPGISRGGPSSGDLFGHVHRVSDGTSRAIGLVAQILAAFREQRMDIFSPIY
jgi:hypothetical protein